LVTTYDRYPDVGDINGPFLGSLAVSEGALTRNQLRSPWFRRLYRNVYVPMGYDRTHELRCRAAALVAPPEAVLTGNSAATVHGFDLALDDDPVEFVVPERSRFVCQRGMHIRRTVIRGIDSTPWHDIGLATPLRTTLDILTNTRLRRSLPRTVGLLDALLHGGFVTRVGVEAYLRRRRDHGIVRARRALALCDERAESIPESELRVWLNLAGLKPTPQWEVRTEGCLLGRLDLAFESEKVAVEYDGEWHREGSQPEFDARRRAAIQAEGWVFVVITKDELYGDPKGTVARVQDAIRRRVAVSRLKRDHNSSPSCWFGEGVSRRSGRRSS
jgi:very-short-patch-repair endonuclease